MKRLDKLLVERGLAKSREAAREMIESGIVEVGGIVRDKAAGAFPEDVSVKVTQAGGATEWVSRGARKLIKGLDELCVDPAGKNCVDIGASTGGFTQVLLSRGAARVAAVDVGYGQFAWILRSNPRVCLLERTNARFLTRDDIGWDADLITVDASFISLRLLLPNLKGLLVPEGRIIALVKPQFEVGRRKAGRGVVRDPALHLQALSGIALFSRESLGLSLLGATYSPIRGPEGNIEFIFLLGAGDDRENGFDIGSADFLARLVREAHEKTS
ncbi:MAG: TlyA family RNA methyltransferase [Synergistaceae bacterium]|nr:TlyA family RNA methyltransferase [Synergistaceae bacterium]